MSVNWDRLNHPCFNHEVRYKYCRIHLPVAPKCNIQCNFCDRKYSCVNESRPGVTGAVLSPGQALHYLKTVVEKEPRITVVGIAGPGDPFANPEETMSTLRLVRREFPEMLLCVATNGFNIAGYVDELAALNTSHVTLTVNAVDPEIGREIYAWVRDGRVVYRGSKGAEILLSRQLEAIKELKKRGITVKVNTIVIPGINQDHVIDVARKMSELGVDLQNCIPLYPTQNTVFAAIPSPSGETMRRLRQEAEVYLPQMTHCTRCRADAVGFLGEPVINEMLTALRQAAHMPLNPEEKRPYIAVATMEGVLINRHLGEATEFYIYGESDSGYELREVRVAPRPGGGDSRWHALAKILHDCRTVLVSGVGEKPYNILRKAGIMVLETGGLIDEALRLIKDGAGFEALKKTPDRSCFSSCSGAGPGCG